MQEIVCNGCGASLLDDGQDDLSRCPHCGRDPRRLNRAQQLEAAKAVREAANAPPPAAPKSPGVAAVLSFFVPGAGQIYNGQLLNGLGLFALAIAGLAFCGLPTLLVWLLAIFDAYTYAERFNRPPGSGWTPGPKGIVAILASLGVAVVAIAVFSELPRRQPTADQIAAQQAATQEVEALRKAEKIIAGLLDPRVAHTARFPMFSQSTMAGERNGQRVWVVRGEVFVTNVFGAEVRHTYAVFLAVAAAGDKPQFTPLSVLLNGERVYGD